MLEFDPRALAAVERLRRAGFDAALVGGCVRDSLLGLPPHDYDAATAARPEEIRALFAGCPQYDAGSRFGTVAVELDGLWVEVTTFRREEGYADHRRPDRVAFSPRLEDDLARRDFTINAMAWGPAGLVDRFGGRADLERRLVRCVGDPDRRFREDALRPLRGLRLAAQLDFALEEETAAAVRRHLPELSHVAWERVREEFLRLICSPGAGRVLLDFPEMAVQVLPELGPAVGFDQRNPHHLYDVYTHSVRALEGVSPSPALRLAALLHDVGKPSTFTLDESGTGHFYGHDRAGLPLADRALERLRVGPPPHRPAPPARGGRPQVGGPVGPEAGDPGPAGAAGAEGGGRRGLRHPGRWTAGPAGPGPGPGAGPGGGGGLPHPAGAGGGRPRRPGRRADGPRRGGGPECPAGPGGPGGAGKRP